MASRRHLRMRTTRLNAARDCFDAVIERIAYGKTLSTHTHFALAFVDFEKHVTTARRDHCFRVDLQWLTKRFGYVYGLTEPIDRALGYLLPPPNNVLSRYLYNSTWALRWTKARTHIDFVYMAAWNTLHKTSPPPPPPPTPKQKNVDDDIEEVLVDVEDDIEEVLEETLPLLIATTKRGAKKKKWRPPTPRHARGFILKT